MEFEYEKPLLLDYIPALVTWGEDDSSCVIPGEGGEPGDVCDPIFIQ